MWQGAGKGSSSLSQTDGKTDSLNSSSRESWCYGEAISGGDLGNNDDEMGWAEVPGTQQVLGANHGTWMWRLTAFLREVGSAAHTEKLPFTTRTSHKAQLLPQRPADAAS